MADEPKLVSIIDSNVSNHGIIGLLNGKIRLLLDEKDRLLGSKSLIESKLDDCDGKLNQTLIDFEQIQINHGHAMTSMQMRNNGTLAELDRANQNLNECISDSALLSRHLNETGQRLEATEEKLSKVKEDVTSFQSWKRGAERNISDLELEIKSLQDTLKEKDIKTLEERNCEKHEAIIEEKNKSMKLEQEVRSLASQFDGCAQSLNATRSNLTSLSTRLSESESKMSATEEILSQVNEDFASCVADLNQTRTELGNATEQLTETRDAKVKIQRGLKKCDEENARREGITSELKSKLEQTQIDFKQTRINLDQAMTDMQIKHNETLTSLQTCRESDESRSNAISSMNRTMMECQTRIDMTEEQKVDLEAKHRACTKSVSMLRAIVTAIKNHFH